MLFQTDPRSLFARSNLSTGFVLCPCIEAQRDQGSVAPTSQSQRYYDKILTILSDPRSMYSGRLVPLRDDQSLLTWIRDQATCVA